MNKTTINIEYGKLIDPFFKDFVEKKYPDYEFPTEEDVLNKVNLFKEAWKEKGGLFMNDVCNVTELEFQKNIIDCFIVSATPKDMSAPLIIRSRYTEEEFLDTIYHELLHILLTGNKIKKAEGYDEETKTTVNHINIFAILKYYYLDILNDASGLERVVAKSEDPKNIDYKKAWDIVDEVGYKKLIEKIRQT